MCRQGFWKRLVAFGLTLSLGLLIVTIYRQKVNFADKIQARVKSTNRVVNSSRNGNGIGFAACGGEDDYKNTSEKPAKTAPSITAGVKILSKPRANYTDAARANFTQGKVVLRVTFSADGRIGAISVISGLPDGLTERAIEAAKGIKFEPARRGPVSYSVTKPVEYTFTIY